MTSPTNQADCNLTDQRCVAAGYCIGHVRGKAMTNQDNNELREKYADFNHILDGRVLATPKELETHFAERQLQLVNELIRMAKTFERLTGEKPSGEFELAVPIEILERKKQELGGKI